MQLQDVQSVPDTEDQVGSGSRLEPGQSYILYYEETRFVGVLTTHMVMIDYAMEVLNVPYHGVACSWYEFGSSLTRAHTC